jgi:hypothetical protein
VSKLNSIEVDMELLVREKHEDEVEQEVTQRDQFNTDEVTLVATIVREPHQNSLDARQPGSNVPVRTRFRFHEPKNSDKEYFLELFNGLSPHLVASDIDLERVDFGAPRILVIEDFGTTGLSGEFDNSNDMSPFNDFWRRIGTSHKGGVSGGRWGLGKLVFSSASQIRTFFGLTIRLDDLACRPLLMGQSVLKTHVMSGVKYAPHIFFGRVGSKKLQLPETELVEIEKFRSAFGITRLDEPGLSIAVPFVLDDITPEALVPEVIRNYFFPILTGKLVVEVDDMLINAETFDDVAISCLAGSAMANRELMAFIRRMHIAPPPDVILNASWTESGGLESAIESIHLVALREKLAASTDLVHVRAPITIRRQSGVECATSFDLYLQKAPVGVKTESLFVRGAITVPEESRYFRGRNVFGALVAADEGIAEFLGDAENPAHTRWNGNADKLKRKWKSPSAKLSSIRHSLDSLYNLLAQAIESEEPDALIDVFSIEGAAMNAKKRAKDGPTVSPPMPDLPTSRKLYRIVERQGGFSIRAAPGLTMDDLPLQIKVKAAYDILRGDPLRKYSPLDFDFNNKGITINDEGANCVAIGSNELQIDADALSFFVDVDGFDIHRDLLVKATR